MVYQATGHGRNAQWGDATISAPVVAPSPNRELKELAALLDTFLKLQKDLVLDDILSLVLMRSIEFADAARGMILLERGKGAESAGMPASGVQIAAGSSYCLDLAMARNRDGTAIEDSELAISQKIPEEVLATGTGVIVADLLHRGQSRAARQYYRPRGAERHVRPAASAQARHGRRR